MKSTSIIAAGICSILIFSAQNCSGDKSRGDNYVGEFEEGKYYSEEFVDSDEESNGSQYQSENRKVDEDVSGVSKNTSKKRKKISKSKKTNVDKSTFLKNNKATRENNSYSFSKEDASFENLSKNIDEHFKNIFSQFFSTSQSHDNFFKEHYENSECSNNSRDPKFDAEKLFADFVDEINKRIKKDNTNQNSNSGENKNGNSYYYSFSYSTEGPSGKRFFTKNFNNRNSNNNGASHGDTGTKYFFSKDDSASHKNSNNQKQQPTPPSSQSMTREDALKILGLDQSSSASDIEKTYKKLALKYHPDRNRKKSPIEQEEAKKKFVEISSAVEFLRKK